MRRDGINGMKCVSIVVPVYYNELNLPETIPQLIGLANDLPGYALELILVDDGSGDRSLEVLLDFQNKYPNKIKVVKLTRNFGSMSAIQAGFTLATGDCVGVIAADLQDPPELLVEMVHHWEHGNKAIFAVRQEREESIIKNFFSNSYYSLIRKFAIRDYPSGGFDFLLADRQVVDEVNRIHEKNTNFMTLIYWLGFKSILIPYTRKSRKVGKSRWTLRKKIKLFLDTFVGFSYLPIQLLSVIGFIVALGSFLYGAFILIYKIFQGIDVAGWVPMMVILTFTAGLQMCMLGILGEYLWRTLDETRKRPSYVIDKVFMTSTDSEEKK